MAQTKSNAAGGKPVGDIATLRADFNPRKTILLGTFGTKAKPGALVRLPSGTVKKVATGDTVEGAVVQTIGEGKVVLAKGTNTRTMHSPGTAGAKRVNREPAAR